MDNEIKLSDAEWKLMSALWEKAPRTLSELVSVFRADSAWSKSTVVTLLRRMQDKGAVRFEEGARARRYYPAVSRGTLVRQETGSFIQKVCGGNTGLLLSALVDEGTATPQELAALRAVLDRAKEASGQ